MPFEYQKHNRYLARTARGLTPLAAAELRELGAEDIRESHRGLYFRADAAVLYRVNFMTRLCTRVTAPLLTFDCHSTKYLYKTASKIPWDRLIGPRDSFAVAATVANSKIRHSQYAALCLKDAVVDWFRQRTGRRPSVDRRSPTLRLDLAIINNKALIGLDTAGGSLHRRGYRIKTVEAPMRETVAAAIIRLSGWDGERPLIDPMCGSGTLLSEAHMRYCRVPAAVLRKRFGFEALPDFNPALWQKVRASLLARQRPLPDGLISGADIDPAACAAAKANLAAIADGGKIPVLNRDYRRSGAIRDAVIVCNPPHGIRLRKKGGIESFTGEFGNFLKRRCQGSTAYLYFGDKRLLKHVGLRPTWKKPLASGGLDGVLAKYDIYA